VSNRTRALLLGLFILSTSTVGAYLINSFLPFIETLWTLPRVGLYSPLASLLTNITLSSTTSDPKALARFAALREFASIQIFIFIILLFLTSRFAFARSKPSTLGNALLCSLFVIPGILIMRLPALAFLQYRAPDVRWAPIEFQNVAAQMLISVPFYALLFLPGAKIFTDDEQPAKGMPPSAAV
jgi:hypothetical protein